MCFTPPSVPAAEGGARCLSASLTRARMADNRGFVHIDFANKNLLAGADSPGRQRHSDTTLYIFCRYSLIKDTG
jgi:hypothetical protein